MLKFAEAYTNGDFISIIFYNQEEIEISCQDMIMEEDTRIIEVSLDGDDALIVEEYHADGMIIEVYYSVDEILEIAEQAA